LVLFVPLLVLAACNEEASSRETQAVKLGHLDFEIPSDWRTFEQPPAGQLSGAWTPPSNDRKESIVVARSEVDLSLVSDGSTARLEQMLRQADAALPHARATPPLPVTTEQGLHGLRLSVDFVPPGSKDVYHRVHVVLRDKDALIHVIYTALSPEPANEPLEILLSTLRHEEA
jgi:hypothetical protein